MLKENSAYGYSTDSRMYVHVTCMLKTMHTSGRQLHECTRGMRVWCGRRGYISMAVSSRGCVYLSPCTFNFTRQTSYHTCKAVTVAVSQRRIAYPQCRAAVCCRREGKVKFTCLSSRVSLHILTGMAKDDPYNVRIISANKIDTAAPTTATKAAAAKTTRTATTSSTPDWASNRTEEQHEMESLMRSTFPFHSWLRNPTAGTGENVLMQMLCTVQSTLARSPFHICCM